VIGQNATHAYADNGTYTATLTVRDSKGISSFQTLNVTVNNVAPIVDAGSDVTIDEGQAHAFNATYTDPGILDTHTITWDFGDGAYATNTLNPTHLYNSAGTYLALLTVTDNSGASSTDTIKVQVNNLAPTITNITSDTIITEGTPANFTATATDPGNDTLTYTWNFGDGTDPIEGQSISHIFADNGDYTVTLTVTDSDGAASVQTLNTKVSNVAPIVDAGTDFTTNEGQAIAFNGNFTDPGILDTHTINWDFGDGTTATNILNPIHTYSDNGTYLVSMTVRDNAGASTTDTLTVTVNNVAPTITQLTGTTEVEEGTPATFNASATDPGNDTLTYTWNFGDGSNLIVGKNVNHTFADNGNYTVTLTVKDDFGASTTQTLTTKVRNVAATVDAGANQIMYQNEPVIFDGQFTDPGILDTHIIEWNFGDGNTVAGVLNPSHTYTVDGEYTVTLTITDNSGAVSNDTMTVTVKKPPTIQAGDVSIIEGDNGYKYAVFTATISEASLRTVTANYSTTDGTAASGSDYIATNGTISFAIGEISKTIAVQVLGDTLDEFDETFFLNLSDATNATIAKTRSVGTILDNDEAPTLAILDKTITEGDNGTQIATFTVSLSAASAKPITVKYATADGTALAGTDYTATSGAITFAPGETTKTVEVQVLGDTLDEFDETFFLNILDATNATIAKTTGVGTIIDNDAPPVLTINDRTITEGDNGMMAVTYTVSLNTASGKPVTVDYTTIDGSATAGSDYTATNGKLTFAAGETTKTITVQVLGDSIDEFDENFGLNLNNATNATIGKGSSMTTIIDNDLPPVLTINDRTITEGHNGTQILNFTVSLNAPSAKPISVQYATANGTAIASSDYTATSGILTFAAGETTKTIAVQIIGDRLDEQNENFFVYLSEAINANIVDAQGIGTIIDDDESPTLNVAAVPGELWPPNHKMVEVKVNVNVSDDFDANPTVRLLSITSNEPDNGLGDGDTAGDIEIRSDGRIFLRAERSGNGNGRIYTLTYSATDSAGNVTYSTTQVRVPKNQGK
jgi:PKD repeat protein